jgi:5'-3' exonuclease
MAELALANPSSSDKPRLLLIDGSGYIFRAFFALPPLTDKIGTPVGAVFGFCNMLFKLAQDRPDDQMIVVFDKGSHSFRNDMYANYKANRDEPPEDLIPQFPWSGRRPPRSACRWSSSRATRPTTSSPPTPARPPPTGGP